MEISGSSFDFDDMFSGSPEQKDGMREGAGSRTPGQQGTCIYTDANFTLVHLSNTGFSA